MKRPREPPPKFDARLILVISGGLLTISQNLQSVVSISVPRSNMFKLAVITLSFFGMLLAGQVQAMPMPDTLAQVRRPFMLSGVFIHGLQAERDLPDDIVARNPNQTW